MSVTSVTCHVTNHAKPLIYKVTYAVTWKIKLLPNSEKAVTCAVTRANESSLNHGQIRVIFGGK